MKYPVLPGLTPDGTVYENPAMGTVEAMLPPGPYATAHAPTLLELENGDLLCAWFAGSYEGSADVSVICSRLEKDSGRWSEPVLVSGDPHRSEQNPSLFYGPDNAVWAMYTSQLDRQAGKDNMQPSWTAWKGRTTCSSPPWCAASAVPTAAAPGGPMMWYSRRRARSAASPSKSSPTDAGFSVTGSAQTL